LPSSRGLLLVGIGMGVTFDRVWAVHNRLTWDEIVRLYRLTIKAPPHNLPPRYNICPTDPVDVVTERDDNRDFVHMRRLGGRNPLRI
jgi:hypothetical protein